MSLSVELLTKNQQPRSENLQKSDKNKVSNPVKNFTL